METNDSLSPDSKFTLKTAGWSLFFIFTVYRIWIGYMEENEPMLFIVSMFCAGIAFGSTIISAIAEKINVAENITKNIFISLYVFAAIVLDIVSFYKI